MMRDSSWTGTTLIETLVALLLLSIGILSIAPMFVHAIHDNAVSADLGIAGATASAQMERLREIRFGSLLMVNGGSLTANTSVAGIDYFDDSNPEVILRWQITDNVTPPETKIIAVRAIARRTVVGQPKQATLVSLRGG